MKIGILSMQRVVNYGSFLQAYALKQTLTELGHEVEFVDYEAGEVIVNEAVSETKRVRLAVNIHKVINRLFPPYRINGKVQERNYKVWVKSEEDFVSENMPLLGIPEKMNYLPGLDVLVIGSDEVFNCLQTREQVGYSRQLFGANAKAKKIISYAASFGNTTYEGLLKYKITDEIKGYLSKFSKISVRDKNSGNIIKKLLKINPEFHLDPVFIYNYDKLLPHQVPYRNYIILYAYPYRIRKDEAKQIIDFAKKHNKKVICLAGPQYYFEDYVPTVSPFEVLALIKNADYVVTETFHGTVFSIKYNKKFAVFIRKGHEKNYGNNEKLYDLLDRFSLTSRYVENLNFFETAISKNIDYGEVNQIIENEKNKSIEYFKALD